MKRASGKSDCPLNYTLEILGDHWSLLILRDMFLFGKRRYGEFLKSDEKISTNILANRLATLERNGIIEKQGDEYSAMPKGFALRALLTELMLWGTQYNAQAAMPEKFIRWAKSDPERFRREMNHFIDNASSG